MASTNPEVYDLLIVGSGPAGLSAATSAVRQAHSTIIFDDGKYRNELSQHMHTVIGWDHKAGKDLRAQAIKDFERYGCVTIEHSSIASIEKTENALFEATDSSGNVYRSHKVILATGVEDVFPEIPGYAECWIHNIFHCLYCHGFEEKGASSSGMLATDECANPVVALHFARQSLRLTDEVTMYTNGNAELAKQLEAAVADPPVSAMKVEARKITRFEKGPKRAEIVIHLEDGSSKAEAFLAHKPPSRLRGDLHTQLGLEVTPQGMVKVQPPFNQTSVPGVFAAGDMTSPMQFITQAMFSGTAVGAGAALQLQANQLGQKPLF